MADCVPVGEQMMIEAGELGGSFEKTIGNVVKLLQMMSKIRGALFKAISYPAALVALLYAALVLFGIYVIPPFATALPIDKWTGVAGQMATLSQIVRWAAIPGALPSWSDDTLCLQSATLVEQASDQVRSHAALVALSHVRGHKFHALPGCPGRG